MLGIVFQRTLNGSIKSNWSKAAHKIHNLAIQCISRRLSLQQRIWHANTFLLSKIWFLSKVLPPRKLYTQQIEKYIGYHIWRNSPYRISRDQLRLPLNKGGLNLANVEVKCQTLFIKYSDDIMAGTVDQFEYIFYQQFFGQNSNSTSKLPAHIRPAFQKRTQLLTQGNQGLLPPTRKLYRTLIQELDITPRIVTKYTTVIWSNVWQNIHKSPMASEWRSSLYMFVNEAVVYGERLLRHGRSQTSLCTFCLSSETLQHKFVECTSINNIWSWVLSSLQNKVKLPETCLNKIKQLQFDFTCENKTKNAAMWLIAGYVHYIITSSKKKCLNEFKTTLRSFRWNLHKEQITYLFGKRLFFF